MTPESINASLLQFKVPIDRWGHGEAKTLGHLHREIVGGESQLEERGGRLVRLIAGVSVRIYCRRNGQEFFLVEDRQVFKDGRERRRAVTGLGEKMKQGEGSLAAARRVFTEELGIAEEVPLESLGVERRGPIESNSFPGLLTCYETFIYRADMPDHLYLDEYIERQEDKTNYYSWMASVKS